MFGITSNTKSKKKKLRNDFNSKLPITDQQN